MKGLMSYLKYFLLVVAMIAGMAVQATPTSGKPAAYPHNEFLIDGDSFIPIPWGKETPISWMLLSGSWMLRQGEAPASYFTFKVLNQSGGASVLYIQQIDPKTCNLIGAGMGNLTGKVIYATLRNAQNRDVYRVNLRNFAASSFVKKVPVSYEGTVVMMSVAAINSYTFKHFSMARVNPSVVASPNCRMRLR